MLRRVSLANKCLLLFGLAVVLIIGSALTVAWLRMNSMVDEAETEVSRQMAATWEATLRHNATPPTDEPSPVPSLLPVGERAFVGDVRLEVVGPEQLEAAKTRPGGLFVSQAWARLTAEPKRADIAESAWGLSARQYRFAKAVRRPDTRLEALVYLDRASAGAARAMWINTGFLFSGGILALGLAVLVFYLITNKIILSPVRQLRETADEVRGGNLDTRSDIQTGDEFEDLAEAFNEMLGEIQRGQKELRALNTSLDEKINQLAERNQTLYEAARLKGEFLANVTHELRTPLNSIIGFADLLEEQAAKEAETGEDTARLAKRKRYIDNIISAGRNLLDLITGLLEMAKVEAGKIDLKVKPVNVRDLCEQLAAMMKPQADKRAVELHLEVAENIPPVHTDGGKVQQIVFNLMSNAVKFSADMADELRAGAQRRINSAELAGEAPPTGGGVESVRPGVVTLRAEHLISRSADGSTTEDRVRISVLDNGPGIAPEDQKRIFDKFTQLDSGYGRKHAGTGLGLAICKELTLLLQGELLVDSEVGRGAMFSVILPVALDADKTAEAKLELAFRGSLAAGRG